ncbi:MAG: hypothetical protein QM780_15790 [Hyphomicrobium sp.]|uniref:hypothetical protein n=1 Tax=Hyphomicrobium sp. TaxID=82 RepID=UPI0039E442F6
MTKRKTTVAGRTAALADAFPKHEHQDAFLEAVATLRAEDLAADNIAPLENGAALRVAKAEFLGALHAVFFPPTDGRFVFVWASASHARALVHYTQSAWAAGDGKYGEREPVHFEAKNEAPKS